MNNAANRFGYLDSVVDDSSPQTGIDSSQGSAIVTPAPSNTVRRFVPTDRLIDVFLN
jgi:hypothetical protein